MSENKPTNRLLIDVRCYGEQNDSHSHDYHQLVLPVSGVLELEVEGRGGQVKANQAAVICSQNRHAFAAFEDNQFIVADVPLQCANMLDRLPDFLPLSPSLSSYIHFIATRLQHAPLSEQTQQQILMLLLDLMSEQLQTNLQIDKRVNLARSFLDDHVADKVALGDVAGASHLSVRQLSQLFKQQMGLSPLQYLQQIRMKQAANQLTQSNESIQSVAESVGYNSLAAFSDRFKKHFGHSPKYFRQKDKN